MVGALAQRPEARRPTDQIRSGPTLERKRHTYQSELKVEGDVIHHGLFENTLAFGLMI
jgi:hypothetical protein